MRYGSLASETRLHVPRERAVLDTWPMEWKRGTRDYGTIRTVDARLIGSLWHVCLIIYCYIIHEHVTFLPSCFNDLNTDPTQGS